MKTQANSTDANVANLPIIRRIQSRGKPENFAALYGPQLQQAYEESEEDIGTEDEDEDEEESDDDVETLKHKRAVAIAAMERERVYTSQEQQHSGELDLWSVMKLYDKPSQPIGKPQVPSEREKMEVVESQ